MSLPHGSWTIRIDKSPFTWEKLIGKSFGIFFLSLFILFNVLLFLLFSSGDLRITKTS